MKIFSKSRGEIFFFFGNYKKSYKNIFYFWYHIFLTTDFLNENIFYLFYFLKSLDRNFFCFAFF